MGSRRLSRVVRRQPQGNVGPKASTAVKPHSRHGSSGPPSLQRVKDLQAVLGNQKMKSILEKKPEPVSDPSMQEALRKTAHQQFISVIDTVPSLMGFVAQIQASSPISTPNSPALSSALGAFTQVSQMLAMLDSAIEIFEKGGGDITEIRPIIALRAQLSTLLFYVNQLMVGVPVAPLAQEAVLGAITAGGDYRREEALKKAMVSAGVVEHGPETLSDSQQKLALALRLRIMFLGPPGLFPSAKALKSI